MRTDERFFEQPRPNPPPDLPEHNTSPGNWLVTGDGNNRAKIRKQMSVAPRAFRLAKRAQMTHAQNIAELKLHPMAGENNQPMYRNILKALRKTRKSVTKSRERLDGSKLYQARR